MRRPIIRISVLSGLVAGVFYILFFFAMYLLKVHYFDPTINFDLLVGMAFTGVTIYFFKNSMNFGELRFWQGLIIAMVLSFTAVLVHSVFIWSYLEWINPAYFQESLNIKVAEVIASKDSFVTSDNENSFNIILTNLKGASPSTVVVGKVFNNTIFSFIYGIILSAIFRK